MNIYHIYYTPEAKEVSLMFWGCNIFCKGCYCKRRIYSPMLKDFLAAHLHNNEEWAEPPTTFMNKEQLIKALDELDIETIFYEGQEASIDSDFSEITRFIKERYNPHATVLTNLYRKPDLTYIDRVAFGIKAISPQLHMDYTGVSNEQILNNFQEIYRSGKEVVVESVFIPDYIDMSETENIVKYIASIDKNIPYVILPYFQAGGNPWRRPEVWEIERAGEEIAKKNLNRVFYFTGEEKILREVISVFPDERLIIPDKMSLLNKINNDNLKNT
ncbi:MAG: radical SAM protein [Chloroflexi bacterium]|nr:radical SAM protein [Chloroflexota bacterium]